MRKKIRHNDLVDQLDLFYAQAKRQILEHQSAITGLFPSNSSENSSASIKTSLWAASSIFSLYVAYSKRIDNDQGKAHDLGQSVVKCMRGILFAWMRQSENVELFKANQSPKHALHIKFDLHSGLANDFNYPHLQLDVVSLYLIFLANFIASGLDIIYCMDEVTFIQNLVYYVERAYRTPDYGNWEPINSNSRALFQLSNVSILQNVDINKNNSSLNNNNNNNNNDINNQHTTGTSPPQAHQASRLTTANANWTKIHGGLRSMYGRSLEIHATSIGMAKSALEAINGCNLFGGKGANWSIIYSDVDAHSRNRSIFETMLPRESRSKNTDSYLLATISWPCFATHDPTLYETTKSKILRKLKGRYGLKRFLRDSYGTVIESDPIDQNSSESGNTVEQVNMNKAHQQPITIRDPNMINIAPQPSPMQLNAEANLAKQRKSSYFQRKNTLKMDRSNMAYPNPMTDGLNSSGTFNKMFQEESSSTKMSKRFEHIESEWPLFVCFLIIDGIFKNDYDQVDENEKLLYERLLRIDPDSGDYLIPKYYYVPFDLINNEKINPDTVERAPSLEGSSADKIYITGQSILLITRLLLADLVHPNELDPLRRHMPSQDRPKRIGRYPSFRAISSDLVVQVVLIAESIRLQAMMANYGIQTQTPLEVEPVQIWSSSQLVKVYEYLGVNEKLGLKGRPARPIGALGTSKLYRICGQTILCYPLIFEVSDFYLAQDMLLLIDDIQNELNFIGNYWRMSGRPTVCIIIREEHLKDIHFRDLLDLLVQFKNGKLKKSGLRIKTGRLQNLISSSCIEHLDFLHLLPHEHLPQFQSFRQLVEAPKESLLTMASRSHSVSSNHPLASKRTHLCSASSNNVQAMDHLETSSSDAYDYGNNDYYYCNNDTNNNQNNNLNQSFDEQTIIKNYDSSSNRFQLNSNDLDESYSIIPSPTLDYYECYRDAPTWPNLVDTYKECIELGGRSQLLALINEREGGKYMIDDVCVEDRLERLSQEACLVRNWSVVRYCSSVLKRSVESLSPWLTSILVCGKQISLGTGQNEKIINNPLTPTEIHNLIYSSFSTTNPCDAVLQQEIALYIGRLISTRPDYFEGILTIRVINFMSAMRSYLNIKTNEIKAKRLRTCQRPVTPPLQSTGSSTSMKQQQSQHQQPLNAPTDNDDESSQESQHLLDLRTRLSPSPSPPSFQVGDLPTKQQPDTDNNLSNPIATSITNIPQISIDSGTPNSEQQNHHKQTTSGSRIAQQADLTGSGPYRRSRRRYMNSSSSNLVARPLESLSPSDVRKLLVKVLNDEETLSITDRRQITGELCRVPKDFYDKVWSLLGCTNVGIIIGGKILRSIATLANMTQDDLNFALKVELLLGEIQCPKLRQINVELLMALHVIVQRNPEIRFDADPLDLDKIINLSLQKFRADYGREDYGLQEYYTQSIQSATLYTTRAVFDCLLPERITSECRHM